MYQRIVKSNLKRDLSLYLRTPAQLTALGRGDAVMLLLYGFRNNLHSRIHYYTRTHLCTYIRNIIYEPNITARPFRAVSNSEPIIYPPSSYIIQCVHQFDNTQDDLHS